MNKHRVITLLCALCLLWPAVTDAASVTLRWTAPGDDGWVGQATAYELRYADSPIDDTNWHQAALAPLALSPATAGTAQIAQVFDLVDGRRYFFAIRTVDDAGNWSAISNVVSLVVTGSCVGLAGNVDCDPADIINLSDISALVNHLFIIEGPIACGGEANVNGDLSVNLSDLTYLVSYLFYQGPSPVACL